MNLYEAEKFGKFRHKDLLREGKREGLANKARPKKSEKLFSVGVKDLIAFFL